MEALVQKYNVGILYSADISERKKNGENKIENLAEDLSLLHIKLVAGDKVELGSDAYFEVLGPLEYNDNDNSLILRLNANKRTFLFTGDMQFDEEDTLMQDGLDLSADILMVGNHGNPDATSDEFADAVSPEIAVIFTDVSIYKYSANKRVKSALSGAQILVSADYTCGIMLNVNADGVISIFDPQPNQIVADIEILEIDKDAQTISLINNGDIADSSGYFIFSEKRSEVLVFPKGTAIESGQTLIVMCTGGEGDLIWDDKKVWNTKKEDIGVLYDCYGNEMSRKP
jgi:hypothetical protein